MRSGITRWVAPVIGAAVFLAVLVAGSLVAADWVKRSTEMRALVTQVEVSEAAMTRVQDAERAALDAYQSTGTPTDADRARLHDSLTAAATTGLAEVTHAADLIASVYAMPWHADIRAAQQAYLDHNRAWQAYLAAAAKDPNAFGTTQDDVASTWAAAEPAMRAALPVPDLFGLRTRLDVIFAPPPVTDSGPTQQA